MRHTSVFVPLVLVLGLAACGTTPSVIPEFQEKSSNNQTIKTMFTEDLALSQAYEKTGIKFTEKVDSKTIGNSYTTVFSDKTGQNYLTLSIASNELSWSTSSINSEGQLLINNKIERNVVPLSSEKPKIDPLTVQCTVCTNVVTVPGRYDEGPGVWKWVTRGISAASAGACASLGGNWAGGFCSIMVYEFVKGALSWVPGYKYCANWVQMPVNGPCPDNGLGSIQLDRFNKFYS